MDAALIRSLSIFLLTTHLSGCVAWTRMQGPTPAVDQLRQRPQPIRVHLKDGSVVTFRVPAVRGDTIHEVDRENGYGQPVALADIATIDVQESSASGVILTAIGVFLLVGLIFLASTPMFDWNSR